MTASSKSIPLEYRQHEPLLRPLLLLAVPVLAEQVLHMLVGFNDTWLANHLPADAADAGSAVGTITYILWFIGLLSSSGLGTGSAAIIARARGARHRSLANSVTGQSVTASLALGILLALIFYVLAAPLVRMAMLGGKAPVFALSYMRMLSPALPFLTVMFVANACQRGAGDSVTPAVVMILVDIINMFFSFGLTYGIWGMPKWGFNGIAAGTVIAYVSGGVIQLGIMILGRGGATLHLHRLRPHWATLVRIFRIGIPSGFEGLLTWMAQFCIVIIINRRDPTNIMSAAHINAIRVESISFLSGISFATAAATMVGMSLGMRDVDRARRSAYLAYLIGGGTMTFCGILFILFGQFPARWLAGASHPDIAHLTRICLFLTGFCQFAFASSLIFGASLRGAGDTLIVMAINLATIIGLRFLGVIVVALFLHKGLEAIWLVLVTELIIRGSLIYLRFLRGRWAEVRV